MPTFDPQGFFSVAQSLVLEAGDEASQRSGISRAYYACHLTARDGIYGLDGTGLTNAEKRRLANGRNIGNHMAVIIALSRQKSARITTARAKRLSDQLGQLRDMRECADYVRDSGNTGAVDVFTRHGATSWDELADRAMILASNLLPELGRI